MSPEIEEGRPRHKGGPTTLKDNTSVAIAVRVVPARNTRDVRVICPFCLTAHNHGWPYGEAEVGHRLAHCGRGEYLIEVVS